MTQVDAANPLKVGIVGGTGYTGVELLRLLVRHPLVRLETITSRSEQGLKVSDLYPTLRGYTDLKFEEPDVAAGYVIAERLLKSHKQCICSGAGGFHLSRDTDLETVNGRYHILFACRCGCGLPYLPHVDFTLFQRISPAEGILKTVHIINLVPGFRLVKRQYPLVLDSIFRRTMGALDEFCDPDKGIKSTS